MAGEGGRREKDEDFGRLGCTCTIIPAAVDDDPGWARGTVAAHEAICRGQSLKGALELMPVPPEQPVMHNV